MKTKFYTITLSILVCLFVSSPLFAQYEILFLGNSDNSLDSMTKDYLQLEGYNVTLEDEDDFKNDALYATAAGYEGFDVFLVSESIGSASANNYKTAGFPIPCVVTEGYVVKTDKWGILNDVSDAYFRQASSTTLTADVLTMVITDNEHWITKDYEPYYNLVWAETEDPTKLGVTSFLLSEDVDGAIPLAQFLFDMGGLSCVWAIPEGSTLHGTTTLPNMVFIGIIQTDVGQVFTYEFLDLIRKSVQWVTNDYDTEGIVAPESYDLKIGPNPTAGLTYISLNLHEPGNVRVNIYDIAGKLTKTVLSDNLAAGYNTISLDFSGLPEAQYLFEIITGTDVLKGKIMKR